MFGRISRGWMLMRQSWAVLRLDKELMLFPILSFFAWLLVCVSFVAPIVLVPQLRDSVLAAVQAEAQAPNQGIRAQFQVPAIVGLCFYLVTSFVIVFFNTALVACAVLRFQGGDPTVGYGLRAATARLPQILAWSLVAATVGWVLQMIEQRLSFIGRIIIGFIGLAWSVVTYLVVPVLAVEKVGPLRAVRRSAELLTKTWGEAVVGNISLGIAGFVLSIPGIMLLVLCPVVLAMAPNPLWAIVPGALAVLYFTGLFIVTSTLRLILLAGAYLYAAQGQVPAGFSPEIMQSAFRPKRP
jgi:hypothetical protein